MIRKSVITHHFINMSYFNYFKSSEFFPNCTNEEIKQCFESNYFDNLLILFMVLDVFRDCVGSPIKVTSTYRDYEHNKLVGGSSTSQHLYAAAIDFCMVSMPFKTAQYFLTDFLQKSALEQYLGQVVFYHKREFFHIGLRTQNHNFLQILHYEQGNN